MTPRDLVDTVFAQPRVLHFICSPTRAQSITSELRELGWSPRTIYEPIPDSCIPRELPALLEVLPAIDILSPNAEEALSFLAMPSTVTADAVKKAAEYFVEAGIGPDGNGTIVIRSGALGAYIASKKLPGRWVEAYWTDQSKVVDVTGAGNAFLGGLAAGLVLCDGDVFQATLHATVSASFVIEQGGLPCLTRSVPGEPDKEEWNNASPQQRLDNVRLR